LIVPIFLLLPSVNAAYLLLTALAAQQYIIMYVLMFLAAIKTRQCSMKNIGFTLTRYRCGTWLVSLIGLLGCSALFIIGFIPPSGFGIGGAFTYEFILVIGLISLTLLPLLFRYFSQRS